MKNNFFFTAIDAGLFAGFISIALQMALVSIFMPGKFWRPPRMMAAIVFGKGVLPPSDTTFGVIIVGFIIDYILSILFAIIVGFIVSRMAMAPAIGVGIVIGLTLYFINFYVFTGVFPWFSKSRLWVTVFTHIVYGFVAAWSFKSFYGTWPTVSVINNGNRQPL